ncbi:hypothetical protein DY000_02059415 [Brassica cretica]|uniref:Uncharacterized protein n=1 Tax=Brassica cretica TaxID=69181 RepID=A0ABQ7AT44_BRACR|nr:hypothetical protein DY000_02059415 [Brassica cretica]
MEGESSNGPLRLGGVSEVSSTSDQLGDGVDKDERYALKYKMQRVGMPGASSYDEALP